MHLPEQESPRGGRVRVRKRRKILHLKKRLFSPATGIAALILALVALGFFISKEITRRETLNARIMAAQDAKIREANHEAHLKTNEILAPARRD